MGGSRKSIEEALVETDAVDGGRERKWLELQWAGSGGVARGIGDVDVATFWTAMEGSSLGNGRGSGLGATGRASSYLRSCRKSPKV